MNHIQFIIKLSKSYVFHLYMTEKYKSHSYY